MRRILLLGLLLGIVVVPPATLVWAGDEASKTAKADSGRAFDAAKRGYWQEAMALWENALELDPDDAEVLNNYAVGLEAVGRYEDAGTYYEKALAIDPGSRRIRKNLMLNRDFYMSYVLRVDPESSEVAADDDGAPAVPSESQDEESPPPGEAAEEEGQQGDDDDQA